MVFSTLPFVFFFLPITLIVYFLMPTLRAKNLALMVMSLIFYAWGEPVWVVLMALTAFVNYYCGRRVGTAVGGDKKKWLTISVVISLAFLAFFKYTGFFIDNFNGIFGAHLPGWKLGLPIGISFYTFQAMSYTIDVYRGNARVQEHYTDFLLYVSLFPQLIAGPIVRYVDVQNEITGRKESAVGFMLGITRFLVGLGKKLLLANFCASGADKLLLGTEAAAADGSTLGAWLGIILFTFQIYFDFSGYSDMAIGLGRMFGFHFKDNFDYPYLCSSITDFWRRWHISLSSWFRDYVYIPLGGNRRGPARQVLNLFIVWMLTGFWHGASWNFVLWGLYFAVLLVLEKFVLGKVLEKLPAFFRHFFALFFVVLGWALFYYEDLSALGAFLGRFFFGGPFSSELSRTLLENNILLLIACVIASLPVGKLVRGVSMKMLSGSKTQQNIAMAGRLVFNVALLTLCTIVMATNTYNPFLYFRF